MAEFSAAIGLLVDHEGPEYVPDDNGRGPSKYGVTLKTARQFHPEWTERDIEQLTAHSAEEFYREAFWDWNHIGLIESQAVANKMLDLTANIGGTTAVQILQAAVGAETDGIIGPDTARRTNSLAPSEVLAAIRTMAEAHYRKIVEKNPKYAKFLDGWLARNRSV